MELTCSLVRRYPQHDVRRLQFAVEDVFSDYIKAPSTQSAVPPNAPPNVARFLMADGKRQLAVSDTGAQLNLNFRGQGGAVLTAAILRAAKLMDAVGEILPKARYYSGIVLDAAFIISNLEKTLDRVSAKALVARPSSLHNLNLSAGQIVSDLQVTASFNTFQTYEQLVPNIIGQAFHLDGDFNAPSSFSVGFKYDVNTKPMMDRARDKDFEMVWNNFSAVYKLMADLVGEEVSKSARDRFSQ